MLIQRLVGLRDSGKTVNLLHAFSAFSNGELSRLSIKLLSEVWQMLLPSTALEDHIIELKIQGLTLLTMK